jgi:hypothetical protein
MDRVLLASVASAAVLNGGKPSSPPLGHFSPTPSGVSSTSTTPLFESKDTNNFISARNFHSCSPRFCSGSTDEGRENSSSATNTFASQLLAKAGLISLNVSANSVDEETFFDKFSWRSPAKPDVAVWDAANGSMKFYPECILAYQQWALPDAHLGFPCIDAFVFESPNCIRTINATVGPLDYYTNNPSPYDEDDTVPPLEAINDDPSPLQDPFQAPTDQRPNHPLHEVTVHSPHLRSLLPYITNTLFYAANVADEATFISQQDINRLRQESKLHPDNAQPKSSFEIDRTIRDIWKMLSKWI